MAASHDPRFVETVLRSENAARVLERASALGIRDWYLGGGAVTQIWWNSVHGFAPDTGIKDFDLAYFDTDLSAAQEKRVQEAGHALFADVPIEVELVNQARVHLWYEDDAGIAIAPYASTEDAIDSWPTTATAVGIRRDPDGTVAVHAAFGLDDALNLVVRPNKRKITRDIYAAKARRWKEQWPLLTVVPWDADGEDGRA